MNNNLNKLSICLPFRYDSEDRVVNLKTVIAYFDKHFINHEFLILEEELENVQRVPKEIQERSDVNYQFRSGAEFLHRTRMVNELAAKSQRDFVTVYDIDILVPPIAISETINQLEKKDQFVFPYSGAFIDVKNDEKKKIIETLELPKVAPPTTKLYAKWSNEFHIIHNQSVGGITAFRKDTYLKNGGYNRQMKSWGFNDSEVTIRFSKMGYIPIRINKPLYHLNHQRGIDSTPNHPRLNANQEILNKVRIMNKQMLEKYIKEKLL